MPIEHPPRIESLADLVRARTALLEAIWGPGGWPVANQALRTAVFDPSDEDHAAALATRGIPVHAALGRAEELSVTMLIGPRVHETRAYHLLPGGPALDRLVIVHHGHGDAFTEPDTALDTTIGALLEMGYGVLAMYMPNYGPSPRNPRDVPLDGDRHGPLFNSRSPTSALRAFLEPVAACLGHLRQTHLYRDVHMTGLSGGGWTTALYAAIDPNIRSSVQVSGSLPLDLRYSSSLGDEEQNHAPLYAATIGYRDIYTLGGYGSGRRQVQVLYEHDPCCFSDDQWPEPTGMASALQEYAERIGSLLTNDLGGGFSIARFDDNEHRHGMSPLAIAELKRTIESVVPSASIVLWPGEDGSTEWGRVHPDGRYEPVGVLVDGGIRSTHLTMLGESDVLVHDARGTATVRRCDQDGLGAPRFVGDLPPGTTHVVGAASGWLLVLDAATGRAWTGHLEADTLVLREVADPLPVGWTSVAAVSDNVLCFYDSRHGTADAILLDRVGRLVPAGQITGLPKGAGCAVGAANGALLFAIGTVWWVNELGEARPDRPWGASEQGQRRALPGGGAGG